MSEPKYSMRLGRIANALLTYAWLGVWFRPLQSVEPALAFFLSIETQSRPQKQMRPKGIAKALTSSVPRIR